jgi:hypothetical protein
LLLNPLHSGREFNLFKKRVVIQWPADWTASNTKILRLELKKSDTTRHVLGIREMILFF